MSLITIACDSLTLIFFNIIPAINHTATYFAALFDFKGGERKALPKRWNKDSFMEEFFGP